MHAAAVQVWAVPTTMMQCNWLGERVATVDVDRAISNVIHNKEDAGWGPNAVFRFPTSGGTGAIWKGVAKQLPADKQVRWGLVPVTFQQHDFLCANHFDSTSSVRCSQWSNGNGLRICQTCHLRYIVA